MKKMDNKARAVFNLALTIAFIFIILNISTARGDEFSIIEGSIEQISAGDENSRADETINASVLNIALNETINKTSAEPANETVVNTGVNDVAKPAIIKGDIHAIDSAGSNLKAEITIKDSSGSTIKKISSDVLSSFSEEPMPAGAYNIDIEAEGPVKKIVLKEVLIEKNSSSIIIYDLKGISKKSFIKAYAISTELNFTSAEATVLAKGTELYECKNWDFEAQTCTGGWELFKTGLSAGEEYTFKLDSKSGAFGEIISTSAVHLDSDYNPLSNIYEQVKTKDNVWSEPIYENEFVRVIFDQNLTNGRVIDVYAKSNGTLAYIEFYETGTNISVGRSKIFGGEELAFTEVSGLAEPADTFDFKIVKVLRDEKEKDQCKSECYESCAGNTEENCYLDCNGKCNSQLYDSEREAFIEFDFIHDDIINSTQADGIIVYEGLNVAIPRYRTWNRTNNFGAELSALQTGVSGTDDITWNIIRGSAKRDEMILGTLDKGNDINIQVFNAQKRWDNLTEITADTENSAYQEFDISYESLSGNALIVYENNATTDSKFAYRIWNGTELSAENTFTTGLASGEIHWVELAPYPRTNDIMVVVHNIAGRLYAVPWNGTAMDSVRAVTASTATTSNTAPHFGFAWELSSGEGLLAYGEGNNLVGRTYDPDNALANYWSASGTLVALGNSEKALSVCSAPTTDNIGIIWQTTNNRVGARMWSGSAILASPPADETSTEPAGTNNKNVGCAWTNSTEALFTFIDNNQLAIDYFTFTTATSAWSTANLATTTNSSVFAADDISGLRLSKHPMTSEVMAVTLDIAENARAARWNGTAFQVPATSALQAATEVQNGDQQSIYFDWYRYDPIPNVTGINPAGVTFSPNSAVGINATITDNIAIGSAYATIALPNGTAYTILMADGNANQIYNMTFYTTNLIGVYTISITANDTSIPQNTKTVNSTFNILETTKPNVTGIIPASGSTFSPHSTIQLSTNVTDNNGVGAVYANITLPNTTKVQLALSNSSGEAYKFNNSYTIPSLAGSYTILFFANDTSGNINSTETTSFTITDSAKPNVTSLIPTAGANYEIQSTIQIAETAVDNIGIGHTYANITLPNGTISQIILSNSSTLPNKYNNTYTITKLNGAHTIIFFANDTSGNINSTETTTFNAVDTAKPNVTITSPALSSTYLQNDNISVTALVNDNIQISMVYANITLPNSSVESKNMSDTDADGVYNFTFRTSSSIGVYTLRIFANDSSGNINSTETRTFTIQSDGSPIVKLISPANSAYSNSGQINFTCNASDTTGLANISIYNNISGVFSINNTANVSGVKNITGFLMNISDGKYIWNCIAYDTLGNNAFDIENFTLHADSVSPNVTQIGNSGASYNTSIAVVINVTLSDLFGLNATYANITLPNGTTEQHILSDSNLDSVYNATFIIPNRTGTYTIRIFANDSSGNINSTQTATFTAVDSIFPQVSVMECTPVNASLGEIVQCNATITDNILLSTAWASVTLPDGTSINQTTANLSSRYHFNFTATKAGQHTARWYANDSSGNTNTTIVYFNISDINAPSLSIIAPLNYSNFTENTVFTFNSTDNYYSLLNCSLMVDGVVRQINSSTINSTITSFEVGLASGNHSWNITCNDNSTNKNTSETRLLITDRQYPVFVFLNLSPSSDDELDPNVNITFSANVTDNLTAVSTVLLLYKLSGAGNFTNVTMVYEAGTGLYNTSLNFTVSGSYVFALWANDSLGNSNESGTVTKTIGYDSTWTRSPSEIAPVSASVNVNVSVGNITINNTGDYNLTITLSSSSNATIFNSSGVFNITPKGIAVVNVNETSSTGIKTFTINISSSGTPGLQTTAGTIVSAPGQPVLTTSFTAPSTEAITAKRGDMGVRFSAKVQNIGESTALNTTLYFTMPSEWTVTFGALNASAGDISAGDSYENTIEVSIPLNASLGEFIVTANSSAFNSSNISLSLLNLSFGSEVAVSVAESTTQLGTTRTTGGGASSSPGAGAGGSGSSRGLAPVDRLITGKELIENAQVVEMLRGGEMSFPIEVTNIYSDTTMYDLMVFAEGYLSPYFKINPQIVEILSPGQSIKFNVELASPEYLDESSYDLKFTITGRTESRKEKYAGDGTPYNVITRKVFTENRLVSLMIHEISRGDTASFLNEAVAAIDAMKQAGFPTAVAEELLKKATLEFEQKNYKNASMLGKAVISEKEKSFSAHALIEEVKLQIKLSEEKGIDMSEPSRQIGLALAAFEREDFEKALERAKDAQIGQILLSKGKLNIIWILTHYWWAVLSGGLIASIAGELGRRKMIVMLIERKMADLDKEEKTIEGLIEEAQEKALNKGKMSVDEYKRLFEEYEKRLSRIAGERNHLRDRRAGIIKISGEIERLKKESAGVSENMKLLQNAYYVDSTVNKKTYERKIEECKTRLVEIEKSVILHEARLAKKEALENEKVRSRA